jgi:mannitol/fructose-specific phosphotransferase system IIA component (Ntr-type)
MPNFLTELLEKDSVLSPVLCYSKKKTFEIIAMAASKKVGLDAVHLLKLLNERESLGSTYIANGFVFPHAVIPDEYTETAVLLLLDHPISYNDVENAYADIFLVFFLHMDTAISRSKELKIICKDFSDSIKIKQLRFIKNISTQVYNSVIRHFDAVFDELDKEEKEQSENALE